MDPSAALDLPPADPYCELNPRFAPCEFRIKWADSAWEQRSAHALRRAVFCAEQGLFVGDDLDAIDTHAQAIVAIACVGGLHDQVVGTVRIHAAEDGLWWGSRLAVHPSFRRVGRLGAALIRLAVSSAHARGARVFLAHVQRQNTPLFEQLHWQVLKPVSVHGRPHDLMQADLDHYPPCHDPLTGYAVQARPSA